MVAVKKEGVTVMGEYFTLIIQIFQLPFMIRALLVGVLISLCASLLGVSLVLKRYSMIGDGLSHVGFGALALAAAFNVTPLYVAIPVVVLTAFLLLRVNESGKLKGDAAVAMISASALAIGVLIVSLVLCYYMYAYVSVLALGVLSCTIVLEVLATGFLWRKK